MSNSHTKFVWILSSSLGGDSITDGRVEVISISPSLFFKKRGYNEPVHQTLVPITFSSNQDSGPQSKSR